MVIISLINVAGFVLILFSSVVLLKANGVTTVIAWLLGFGPVVMGFALAFLSVWLGFKGSLYFPIASAMMLAIGTILFWQANSASRKISQMRAETME